MNRPNHDDPGRGDALRSLCDVASEQAEEWRSGIPVPWTQARAASRARSPDGRVQKAAMALAAMLALGALAAQFTDAPARVDLPAVGVGIPVQPPTVPAATRGELAATRATEESAPAANATPLPERAMTHAPDAEVDGSPPAEPSTRTPGEIESQPDGSC